MGTRRNLARRLLSSWRRWLVQDELARSGTAATERQARRAMAIIARVTGRGAIAPVPSIIGITPIIASYAQCAAILDRIGAVPGTKGIMLIFPECLEGLQLFGERVLPHICTAKLAPPRPPRRDTVPLMTLPREYAYA